MVDSSSLLLFSLAHVHTVQEKPGLCLRTECLMLSCFVVARENQLDGKRWNCTDEATHHFYPPELFTGIAQAKADVPNLTPVGFERPESWRVVDGGLQLIQMLSAASPSASPSAPSKIFCESSRLWRALFLEDEFSVWKNTLLQYLNHWRSSTTHARQTWEMVMSFVC